MPTSKLKAIRPHLPVARAVSHPTKDKLLQSVVVLMADRRAEDITADMVLAHSGISRGSMYHHFEDFADLMEQALVQRFARTVDASIEMLSAVVTGSKTQKQAFAALHAATVKTNAQALAPVRLARARLLGYAQDNPRLAGRLAIEQSRLTEALADLCRDLQNKGWVKKEFDARAVAVFIQAYSLGRIVDDIATDPISDKVWIDLINKVADAVFAA